jgi:sugar (pentulose or hexulose) kinase
MAIAVLDVGKTNVKVALFGRDGDRLAERSRPNHPLPGPPYRHHDVAAIWAFMLDSLAAFGRDHAIEAIVPTTHGATLALTTDDPDRDDGLALPVIDYEETAVDGIEADYAKIRPPFAETYSPPLPGGLNAGRAVAYQMWRHPDGFAKARAILAYPQYWAWRLSGRAVSEVTSIACHADLWEPEHGRLSSLVDSLGIADRFPPFALAHEAIGTLRPALAAATGLDPATRIIAGIHDSNASLVPHLLTRAAPFTVVSTGTWVVILSMGTPLVRLDPAADMLANVNAAGRPVATAKFMGGREYAALTEGAGGSATPEDIAAVVASGAMALPGFAPAGGPFPGREGRIVGTPPDRPGARAALATLYVALVTDHMIGRLGADAGPLVIEGGFVGTPGFAATLAALRPGQAVETAGNAAGTAQGAALLATWPHAPALPMKRVAPAAIEGLDAYRAAWRRAVAAPSA